MKVSQAGAICAFFLTLVATSADAILVSGRVTGYWADPINEVYSEEISVGDPFEVGFEFDSDVHGNLVSTGTKSYDGAVSSIRLSSGIVSEEVPGLSMQVSEDFLFLSGEVYNGTSYTVITIQLFGTETIFPSLELPANFDLSDFSSGGNVHFTRGGPSVIGFIDTFTTTAVPIPATVWLFGSGLLGLIGVARRKKVA